MTAKPRYRFLQTVIRECHSGKGLRCYRYDLLAHCPRYDRHYIMRAHRSTKAGDCNQKVPGEETMVARGIRGSEAEIREIFLDIAHADDPVDPMHVPEILTDVTQTAYLDGEGIKESREPQDYYFYDRAVERLGFS